MERDTYHFDPLTCPPQVRHPKILAATIDRLLDPALIGASAQEFKGDAEAQQRAAEEKENARVLLVHLRDELRGAGVRRSGLLRFVLMVVFAALACESRTTPTTCGSLTRLALQALSEAERER